MSEKPLSLPDSLLRGLQKAKAINTVVESGQYKRGSVDQTKIVGDGKTRMLTEKPNNAQTTLPSENVNQAIREYNQVADVQASDNFTNNLRKLNLPPAIKESFAKKGLIKSENPMSSGVATSLFSEDAKNRMRELSNLPSEQQSNSSMPTQQPSAGGQMQLNELAQYGLKHMLKEVVEEVLNQKAGTFIELDNNDGDILLIKLDEMIYKCKIIATKEVKK